MESRSDKAGDEGAREEKRTTKGKHYFLRFKNFSVCNLNSELNVRKAFPLSEIIALRPESNNMVAVFCSVRI